MLKLEVPKHWNDLLDIEDFDTYEGPLEFEKDYMEEVYSTGSDDRYPGVSLIYGLYSGHSNYWAEVIVITDEWDLGSSAVEHQIFEGVQSSCYYNNATDSEQEIEYEVTFKEPLKYGR